MSIIMVQYRPNLNFYLLSICFVILLENFIFTTFFPSNFLNTPTSASCYSSLVYYSNICLSKQNLLTLFKVPHRNMWIFMNVVKYIKQPQVIIWYTYHKNIFLWFIKIFSVIFLFRVTLTIVLIMEILNHNILQ